MKRFMAWVNPHTWRGLWVLIVGITLWRMLALYWAGLPTMPDEAQYRFYAATPALSYYSKPPLLPWLMALMQHTLGQGIEYTRLLMPLLHAAIAYLVSRTVRIVAPIEVAVRAGALYVLMPAVSYSSGLVTTDPVMMFGWALALLGATWAQQKPHLYRQSTALIGVGVAWSILGKYIGALWVVSALCGARVSARYYKYLLYALGGAALLLLPHAIGLAWHGFDTVQHTADNISGNQVSEHGIDGAWWFWLGQIAVMGAVPLWLLLRALVTFFKQPPHLRWLLHFVWPLLLLMTVQGYLSRAHANWAAAAYIAGCAAVALSLPPVLPRVWRWSQVVHGGAALALPVLVALLNLLSLVLPARFDPAAEARNFMPVGQMIQPLLKETGAVGVLSDHRRYLSLLIEYAQLSPQQIAFVPPAPRERAYNHYQQYYALRADDARAWLYVGYSAKSCDAIKTPDMPLYTLRLVGTFWPHKHAADNACFRAYVVQKSVI